MNSFGCNRGHECHGAIQQKIKITMLPYRGRIRSHDQDAIFNGDSYVSSNDGIETQNSLNCILVHDNSTTYVLLKS